MSNKEPGYVYILTNPSFREDWVKIGKSSRPVDVRSKELDNTAVPLPFEIFATMKTVKYNEVEKLVHKNIDRLSDLRIRPNREFFNVSPQVALDILNDIAKIIDDANVTLYKDNNPIILDFENNHEKEIIKTNAIIKKSANITMMGRMKFFFCVLMVLFYWIVIQVFMLIYMAYLSLSATNVHRSIMALR